MIIRTLFVLLFAPAFVLAQKPSGNNLSQSLDVALVLAFMIGFYILLKWFNVPVRPKKINIKPIKPKEWHEVVADRIGEFKDIAPNTKLAGYKVSEKKDVDTFIFMAKVDKSSVRADENKKVVEAEKANKKLRNFVLYLSFLLFALVVFLIYWFWWRSGR
jgi:hypothetical protein